LKDLKRCLFTILNDDFVIAYIGFIKSFLYYNKWFDDDFVILDLKLSDESKKTIRSYYDKIVFQEPKYNRYKGINFDKTHERLKATYYTLDAFSLTDYDRVVALDMDVVVLADIQELFDRTEGFVAVKAFNSRLDRIMETINSGVFVVNKEYLDEGTYSSLLQIASRGHTMPDQKTINSFFKDKMAFANKSFNVEKRMINTKQYKYILEKIKILHYVGSKPWDREEDKPEHEKIYGKFEDIWHRWYNYDYANLKESKEGQ
jgi:lipopolysaccharide biosynthesis glycosyltransferase